jgi:hypothetical protein
MAVSDIPVKTNAVSQELHGLGGLAFLLFGGVLVRGRIVAVALTPLAPRLAAGTAPAITTGLLLVRHAVGGSTLIVASNSSVLGAR